MILFLYIICINSNDYVLFIILIFADAWINFFLYYILLEPIYNLLQYLKHFIFWREFTENFSGFYI